MAINISKAPTTTVTVQGAQVAIPQPFSEGNKLRANEAEQLNQVYAENIRNNLSKKIKENPDKAQEIVNEYAKSYDFGQRGGGGGGRRDPVEQEAMNIARERVRNALKKQGHNLSDFSGKKITELAKAAVDKYPDIREKAKQIVETYRDVGEGEVSMDDLEAS